MTQPLFPKPESTVTVGEGRFAIAVCRVTRTVTLKTKGAGDVVLHASTAKALAMALVMGAQRAEGKT